MTLPSSLSVLQQTLLGQCTYGSLDETCHTNQDFLGSVHSFVNVLLTPANWNASLCDICLCEGLSKLRKLRNNYGPQHCSRDIGL